MNRAVNIVGAAIGIHALGFSALAMLEVPPPPRPRTFTVEPVVITTPPPLPEPVPVPAPVVAPARAPARERPRVATARPRPAAPVATSPITSVASIEPAPARESPPPPSAPAPGSDAAVLLSAIGNASRNDSGIDGGLGNADGKHPGASRGSAFLRGGARGLTTPAHESKAEPARPVEDYTRLTPRESSASIEHDVSASVAVRLEVDEEGRVTSATILKGAGYGLDEIALETVKGYKFEPARDDEGRPVRAVFGWRLVWESHWKRLVTETIAGHPNCRGQGPLNLGEVHPVYIDCDGEAGYFELTPDQR